MLNPVISCADIVQFVKEHYPNVFDSYRLFHATPEELIGLNVISIVPGYSGSSGTLMRIKNIVTSFKDEKDWLVEFVPSTHSMAKEGASWSTRYINLYKEVSIDQRQDETPLKEEINYDIV